jgi:hypothetical protein
MSIDNSIQMRIWFIRGPYVVDCTFFVCQKWQNAPFVPCNVKQVYGIPSFCIVTSADFSLELADHSSMKFPFVLWRFPLIVWGYTE